MRRQFVFFFQAEDGIRDVAVTGVQTCALPIWAFPSTSATAAWAGFLALPTSSTPMRIRAGMPTAMPWSAACSACRGCPWVSAPACAAGCACRRSEEHTSELQSRLHLVCRLLLEKKKMNTNDYYGLLIV